MAIDITNRTVSSYPNQSEAPKRHGNILKWGEIGVDEKKVLGSLKNKYDSQYSQAKFKTLLRPNVKSEMFCESM